MESSSSKGNTQWTVRKTRNGGERELLQEEDGGHVLRAQPRRRRWVKWHEHDATLHPPINAHSGFKRLKREKERNTK